VSSSFPGCEEEEKVRIGPWTRLSSSTPYANPWIRVEHHEVVDPSGRPGIYGVVRFLHRALGCVPLHDDGTVTLVGQHRYALDLWSWEIPEGGGALELDPLDEAKRELAEETGLAAKEWIPLGILHTSNSVCDETAHLWLARGLSEGDQNLDTTEHDLRRMRVPFEDALAMALDGRITDAISVACLLRARHWLETHPS
jgi:8-oxo-dGTP pyrophosphatase MutT (NUDIX family)